ncbi:hypothetical protein SAMN05428996_0347 [Quadrisphaera sp. DSM 44207]|nr:hypothetical protein SAMN05428996_0347 [Quadrisphaera sp. DSM 44207]
MADDGHDEELARLRAAMLAYEASPRRRRLLLRLTGQAPDEQDRERLRRHEIGPHGRIAETALRVVRETEAITRATVERDVVQDLTLAELRAVHEELLGRRATAADPLAPDVSLLFRSSPEQSALLARVLPGLEVDDVPLRRYAALAGPPGSRPEPFLVHQAADAAGRRTVLGRLWLDADFLLHEQCFGAVPSEDLMALEQLVQGDLWVTLETVRALAEDAARDEPHRP